ncbi:MAG: hypothetical protein H8F28_19060, partial [Fibrella sp.]|nr:hypothetical protein [Armatimonadota bacterium]
ALDCQQARDYLVRTAFQPLKRRDIRTIKGLAAFAPDEAYAAAIRLLRDEDEQDRIYALDLLLDIDVTRAIPELFNLLVGDRTQLVMRHRIAYALSEKVRAGDEKDATAIREHITGRTTSPEPRERWGACFVLGFLPLSDDISQVVRDLIGDQDVRVYEAACVTWNRMENARAVGLIVDSFSVEDDPARRRILLRAALKIGEPGETQRAEAPEWLNRMGARLTPLEWQQATEMLRKRRDKRDERLRREEDRETRELY